jgi:hypothetical protein
LPVRWLAPALLPADALPPEVEPIDPDEPVDEPDEPPIAPLLDPLDPDEPIEPEEPLDPDLSVDEPELEPPDEPADPVLDWPPAGSAMSRLARPRPATIPFLTFIWFPLHCSVGDGPGTRPCRVVLASLR